MSDVCAIAARFIEAYYGGDREGARRYLHDGVRFAGPGTAVEGADRVLAFQAHATDGLRGVRQRKSFTDGEDVCLFYDIELRGGAPSIPVAQWLHFEGDRIASMEMILDTGPFVPKAGAAAAVDPVCGMAVDTTAPAATRVHAGLTYYFCNAGCAEAFEQDPERYLSPSR